MVDVEKSEGGQFGGGPSCGCAEETAAATAKPKAAPSNRRPRRSISILGQTYRACADARRSDRTDWLPSLMSFFGQAR